MAGDAGLVGYWKLEGDCADYSGLGNHGLNHGVVLKEGKAARFDGLGSYVEVPASATLQLGKGDFTVTAWVKCHEGARFTGDIVNKYDPETRRGLNLHISASSPGYSSVSDARYVQFGIDNAVEGEWADCGRPWPENTLISTLTVFEGQLYTGIADALAPEQACHVFRYAGGQDWVDCGRVGSNLECPSVMGLIVHKGKLYAATGAWNYWNLEAYGHPSVYRYEGGATWHDCRLDTPGKRITSLASLGEDLYASDDAGFTYRYEADGKWVVCGQTPDYKLLSMMVFQDRLYGGASSLIHRYAGKPAWDIVAEFNPVDICQVHTFAVYEGKLWAGTWERGRLMRRDGDLDWAASGDTGALNDTVMREDRPSYNNEINDLVVYNGKLYAGVIPKGEVWRYDGDHTTLVKRLVNNLDYSPEVHASWRRVPSMTSFEGKLYCGTSTASGVPEAAPTDEAGKVFCWQAGQVIAYEQDLSARWHHLAAIREAGRLRLYIEGKLVSSSEAFDPADYDLSNNRPLLIGFGAENYFCGELREVRLYDRALDEGRIKNLASSESD